MLKRTRAVLLAMIVIACTACSGARQEIRTIPVRPEVTLNYFFRTPAAGGDRIVVMFTRGGGQDNFRKEGDKFWFSEDFLMRSMDRFVALGYAVAAVGLPSDLQLMTDRFRVSDDHYTDIRALCELLARDGYASIYLASSGSGSISVLPIANRGLPPQVKGVILANQHHPDLLQAPLAVDSVRIPVLMLHHEADACERFLPEGAAKMRELLARVTKTTLVTVSGGKEAAENVCDSLGPHGFYGVEDRVVQVIDRWISGTPVPERITDGQ